MQLRLAATYKLEDVARSICSSRAELLEANHPAMALAATPLRNSSLEYVFRGRRGAKARYDGKKLSQR